MYDLKLKKERKDFEGRKSESEASEVKVSFFRVCLNCNATDAFFHNEPKEEEKENLFYDPNGKNPAKSQGLKTLHFSQRVIKNKLPKLLMNSKVGLEFSYIALMSCTLRGSCTGICGSAYDMC